MLQILQARFQQCVNGKLPNVQARFRKGRGTQRSNCQTSTSVSLTMLKSFTVWIITNYGKLLKRWEYQNTSLLRNQYADQEATIKTGHGTKDLFKTGEGACQGCLISPCLFNFYVEYIMQNAKLDESQAGIKIAGRNVNNIRYSDVCAC